MGTSLSAPSLTLPGPAASVANHTEQQDSPTITQRLFVAEKHKKSLFVMYYNTLFTATESTRLGLFYCPEIAPHFFHKNYLKRSAQVVVSRTLGKPGVAGLHVGKDACGIGEDSNRAQSPTPRQGFGLDETRELEAILGVVDDHQSQSSQAVRCATQSIPFIGTITNSQAGEGSRWVGWWRQREEGKDPRQQNQAKRRKRLATTVELRY